MKRIMVLALCGVGLATGVALAKDDPGGPPIFAVKDKVPATLTASPVKGSTHLGDQALLFEKTRLSILAKRADARIGHRAGPGQAMSWICLTDEASGTRLWLSSDDDEGDDTITGLTWVKLPKVEADERCPDIPEGWRKVSLPHGLKLGMSDETLRAELGAPSYDQKGVVGYVFTQPSVNHGNAWVSGSAVWTAINGGKVGLISLSQRTD